MGLEKAPGAGTPATALWRYQSMATYDTGPHKRGRTVRHSRDDALSDREFELLLEGAASLDDYYGIQAQFLTLVLGRLGLRRGEVGHMQADWVDWRQEMIRIPDHEPCHGERNGDGPCGYCHQLAAGRADRAADLDEVAAIAAQWQPKTAAAARDVYFGFDTRTGMFIERFFDRFEEWTWSVQAINRRIDKAAEAARGLDAETVRPHALRATAASFHAGRGLETHNLMQYFGWSQMSTAEVYLSRNPENTARQLDAIHSG